MYTYISLLRGINVNGKNKLPMAALKNIYETLGGAHVTTYIQSGNVIFSAAIDVRALENSLKQTIQEKWGYIIPALVRKAHFFNEIIDNNPFKGYDPNTLYVTLLGDVTHGANIADVADKTWRQDKFVVQKDIVYVHCPHGYGRTKLNNSFFEAKGHTWATTRNWKTVCKLTELAMAHSPLIQ